MRIFLLTLIIFIFSYIITQKSKFNAQKLQEMNRISSPVLSPDGLYVIYSVRKWDSKTDNSYIIFNTHH